MAKQDNKTQIKELLTKLEKSGDRREKQKIRKELRKLGHRGGIRSISKNRKANKK